MDNDPQKPDPSRFHEYIEELDKSGFRLEGCDFFFEYDQYGGWRDEYGNYYNKNCQPCQQPEEHYDDEEHEEGSDDDDHFEKLYGTNWEVEDEFENEISATQEVLEKISNNLQLLEDHDKNLPLRVNFEVLDLNEDEQPPTKKELFNAYSEKVKGIINVFYDDYVDESEEHEVVEKLPEELICGSGYFVMTNPSTAEALVQKEGKSILDYDITFDVEPLQKLFDAPLKEYEKVKFVGNYYDKGNKVCVVYLENGSKFKDKAKMKAFLNECGIKYEIKKILSSKDKEGKLPVIEISPDSIHKIMEHKYEGEAVKVEEYKRNEKEKH